MRPHRFGIAGVVLTGVLVGVPSSVAAQLPLPPVRGSGQTVTPVYEGWYDNPDGTITVSFGYFNRNAEEVLEIPLGENNFIEPTEFNGMQPTHFQPSRHWGVFGVRVPADFGEGRVEWTLTINRQTFMIPGHLGVEWKIDALEGEAGAGNTPPVLSFAPSGPEAAGPGGIHGEPLSGRVGQPVTVTVWTKDDGRGGRGAFGGGGGRGRGASTPQVTLTWFKHQGPGEVTFSEESAEIEATGGQMTTMATFHAPGEYVLRVRANDASGVSSGGHAQCCWTNGFVKVTVTR